MRHITKRTAPYGAKYSGKKTSHKHFSKIVDDLNVGKTTTVKLDLHNANRASELFRILGYWFLTFHFKDDYYIITSCDIDWRWYSERDFKFEMEI